MNQTAFRCRKAIRVNTEKLGGHTYANWRRILCRTHFLAPKSGHPGGACPCGIFPDCRTGPMVGGRRAFQRRYRDRRRGARRRRDSLDRALRPTLGEGQGLGGVVEAARVLRRAPFVLARRCRRRRAVCGRTGGGAYHRHGANVGGSAAGSGGWSVYQLRVGRFHSIGPAQRSPGHRAGRRRSLPGWAAA
jgi:hypothetical protein